MANPRIFVSSTCYDLQEVRYQLRHFIEDFGFEPVMSEFGDIFYDFNKHVQEACKIEIEKCQLFVLIIGNNYGSLYYKNTSNDDYPDSVTLQEFKKALEVNIYKHIFIQKFVDYDYKNYRRALEKKIEQYFENNTISDDIIVETIQKIRNEFDLSYYFPNAAYKYIFYFIDVIYELQTNNAIITYESFDDIKNNLRKQWAGFMYESLTRKDSVPVNLVKSINDKVDKVENQLKSLIENKVSSSDSDNKLSFDISKLISDFNIENFEKVKNELYESLELLIREKGDLFAPGGSRVIFRKEFDIQYVDKLMENVKEILVKYKWSKSVKVNEIFKIITITYYINREDIPYYALAKFYQLYINILNKLKPNEQENFKLAIAGWLNENYEAKTDNKKSVSDDDLPF